MAQKEPKFTTPEGILMFPGLFEPKAFEEGGKETYATLSVSYHQHSKHLTPSNLGVHMVLRGEVLLYLFGSKAREWVWLIVEWPREEFGERYGGYILLKTMQL